MTKPFVAVLGWLALLPIACAADSTSTDVRSKRAALSVPTLVPVPCDEEGYVWNGTRVELLFADALAGCASGDILAQWETKGFPMADRALLNVVSHTREVTGNDSFPLHQWLIYRSEAVDDFGDPQNCDADNPAVPKAAPIKLTPIKETLYLTAAPMTRPWTSDMADLDLRWAGLNLCVASRLRELSPGTAGVEAILMNNAEQRELLEAIRERAQIAMIQYSLLGSVFASAGAGEPAPTGTDCPLPPGDPLCLRWDDSSDVRHYRIPYLQYFGRNASADTLTAMGRDFATAVQLHTMVSEELASLFARSRSARLERGGDAQTRSDETWGVASWQQRLLAFGYGGDPLATDDKSPWQHPSGLTQPSAPFGLWPARDELPYARQEAQEPQIHTAMGLLRAHGILDLVLAPAGPDTGACRTIDIGKSQELAYTALETKVREQLCLDFDPVTEQCTPVTIPSDPEQFGSFIYYRIGKQHVDAAVRLVADLVGPTLDVADGSSCPNLYGSHDVRGALSLSPSGPDTVVHVSEESLFATRSPRELAGVFGKFSNTRFAAAEHIEPEAPSYQQGFGSDGHCVDVFGACIIVDDPAYEQQRLIGSMRALALTRELVARALERLESIEPAAPERARLNDYFKRSDSILGVTSGAVGPSVALEPVPVLVGTEPFKTLVVQNASATQKSWKATLTVDALDDFWFTPAQGESLVLLAAPDDGWAGNLAAHPSARIFGRSAAHIVVTAVNAGRSVGLVVDPEGPAGPVPGYRRVRTSGRVGPIPLDSAANYWTFFAWRRTLQDLQDTEASLATENPQLFGRIRHIETGVRFSPSGVDRADYFAQDGAHGAFMAKQVSPDEYEPTEPAYDGFGLPRAWVPPANAQILGGTPGVPAFRHYLDAAAKSSADAADAVETAIEGLLQAAADEAKSEQLATNLANETTRTLALMKEGTQELCGYDNPDCKVETITRTVAPSWYPSLGSFTAPSNAECAAASAASQESDGAKATDTAGVLLKCIAKSAIQSVTSTEFVLSREVEPALSAASVPGFSEFSGGQLQSVFIEQWRAIKAPDERFNLMFKQIDAAEAAMATASLVVYKEKQVLDHKCGWDDMLRSIVQNGAYGASLGAAGGPVGAVVGGALGALDGAQQQIEKCQELATNLAIAVAKEYQTATEAIANVTSTITGLTNDRVAIVQSGVAIQQLVNSAKLERERHALELDLFESDIAAEKAQLKTSFGVYRRYRAYDAWRAKALLDGARRYSVAARRGIEAHYVADLSRITQSEAFVASPASWADEVYEYDLSLPAAVGLSVGEATPGGIFSNKVGDYVSNLNAFVDGFAVTRPSAVAEQDVDVVTIKGLAPGQELPYDDGTGQLIVTHPDFGTWHALCPAGSVAPNQWTAIPPVTLGGVEAACVDFTSCGCPSGDFECIDQNQCPKPRPTAARIVFSLDPWGRLNQVALKEPFSARYNARWERLAVNLVGTGIRDCKAAADPLTCYSESFLPFSLRHVGRAWITDYSGQWRALGVPPGQIESGKALAAELWLDPLKDGWSTSYISAVARTEYFFRPLGGTYVLEIQTGQDVRLERLERVQLLMGSSYWVKQE